MRVLWFTNIELPAVRRRLGCAATGGGWLDGLRTALRARGFEHLAVAAAGPEPFDAFEEDGVRYYHVQTPVTRNSVLGAADRWRHLQHDERLLAQGAAIIRGFRPDLIHVHGSEGPFGLLAEDSPVPVLVSLQGILQICTRLYFSGIPAADVLRTVATREFALGRGPIHSCLNMRVAARRESRILRRCRYLAGRTDWDKGIARVMNPRARYYQLEEVLRPGFYLKEWRPRDDDRFVIYSTGGAAPYKGLVNLLEAVALLRESVVPNVSLRIAGEIRGTGMWPIAQRAVDRWRLHGVVEWLGPLGSDDLIAELLDASVYAHPSIVDNSPNAVAEAMVVGVPCVASSAGGIPSLLRGGEDGLLCPPNDVYGLAGCLGAVAADPAAAARLGASARSRARRRHDPDAVAKATVDAYEDVVSRHRLAQA